jgi:hypothetical protein
MFKIKILCVFTFIFSLISLTPLFSSNKLDILGDRDEVIQRLQKEGISRESYYTYEIEEHIEAYDWLIRNAENEEILEYSLSNWENNYVMVKYVYEIQEEAYQWLQKETDFDEVMASVAENPGLKDERDYDLIKSVYERDARIKSSNLQSYALGSASLLFFNLIFFLIFLKDIILRKSGVLKWLLLILFTGPLAIIFYLTFRPSKDGEYKKERIRYYLSRYFLIWWNIYIFCLFFFIILMLFIVSFFEGVPLTNFEFLGEIIFWMGLIFTIFVLPGFIILPSIITGIIMLVNKKSE